jgi:hypothetical protein
MDVDTGRMTDVRTKRTYNLSRATVARVRELSERYGVARSQDAIVEVAVERLYRDVQADAEAALWAESKSDLEFQDEVRTLAAAYRDRETWPA